MNALTANAPGTAKIPVILENDREAMCGAEGGESAGAAACGAHS